MSTLPVNQLPLAPLGAGDLIDRAIRLYRRHLFTLIQIAAPPVVISTIGWVMLTMAWRRAFITSSGSSLGFYVLLGFGGAALGVARRFNGDAVVGWTLVNDRVVQSLHGFDHGYGRRGHLNADSPGMVLCSARRRWFRWRNGGGTLGPVLFRWARSLCSSGNADRRQTDL